MRFRLLHWGAACLAVSLATQASADVINYYYVGGPAIVGPSQLRTGTFSFDTDLIPAGQSLSNLNVSWEDNGGDSIRFNPTWWSLGEEGVERYDFTGPQDRLFESQTLRFDGGGRLVDFSYSASGGGISEGISVSLTGGVRQSDVGEPDGEFIAQTFLADRGYKPGTSSYESLFCGSWHPLYNGSCDSELWKDDYRTAPGTGTLTSDPSEFAAAVARDTQLMLEHPPVNYTDIPVAPVPIPAPLTLLLGGFGMLGLLTRRRRA